MKSWLYPALVLLMLFMLVSPTIVSASDPNYSSFDRLSPEEQTYVTNVRSWITVTETRIDTARADLQTVFLQDANAWYNTFIGELQSVNNGISEIKKIVAHF